MISVLIPVKDDPRLDRLLTELESQAADIAEETEIVVVDASAGRLSWIQARHPHARWLESSPLPAGARPIPHQRNEALAAARGDIFVLTDSDCTPSRQWLQRMVSPIREDGQQMVAGAIRFAGYATVRQPKADGYVARWGTNIAFTRKVYDRVGPYDPLAVADDYDHCLRAGAQGFRIRFVASAVIDHPADPLRKSLPRSFRYGRAAVQLYRQHPSALTSMRDGHVVFTAVYGVAVAAVPLMFRHRILAIALVAPYLAGNPRSVRRQLLNFSHGAGTLVECAMLLAGNKPRDRE
jgi:glycosyltransferase involved in cell wall biosynthesis